MASGRLFAQSLTRITSLMAFSAILMLGCGGAGETGLSDGPGLPQESPPEILSWRHQILSREEYRRLSVEWESYVEEHPKSPRALVEWGDALRYAGEKERSQQAYASAFEVDSLDAAAISAYVSNVGIYEFDNTDWSLARDRLLRARSADPDYPDTYYSLWLAAILTGEEDLAATSLRRMIEVGDMPRPLVDVGYNMLIGAPRNAIVLTNGDNDTYPPLAVQAVMKVRPDVSIVNLSLLNAVTYIKYMRDHGLPVPLDDPAIDRLHFDNGITPSMQMQEILFDELQRKNWPRPILYSVTVSEKNKVLPYKRVMEGLLERIVPEKSDQADGRRIDYARTRLLLDTLYRLDSVTDPLIDWTRESAVARIGRNYAPLLISVGMDLYAKNPPEDGGPYLYRALAITSMHGFQPDLSLQTLMDWEKADPDSKLLPMARELVGDSR